MENDLVDLFPIDRVRKSLPDFERTKRFSESRVRRIPIKIEGRSALRTRDPNPVFAVPLVRLQRRVYMLTCE